MPHYITLNATPIRWVIQRTGGARAVAFTTTEKANFEDLAVQIGLDVSDYKVLGSDF